MPPLPVPDIVLLDTEWPQRALVRAQLLEHGFDVFATNSWAATRPHLRPGAKPRLVIVDLQGLPDPEQVLADLRVLMKPERVLVLSALGSVAPEQIEPLGFRVLKRPIAVGDIVTAATRALR